jgi:hypothetical protein
MLSIGFPYPQTCYGNEWDEFAYDFPGVLVKCSLEVVFGQPGDYVFDMASSCPWRFSSLFVTPNREWVESTFIAHRLCLVRDKDGGVQDRNDLARVRVRR